MIHTEETKNMMSKTRMGKGNPFYGKKHSSETKEKMSKWTTDRNLAKEYDLHPITIQIPSLTDLYYLSGIIDGEGSIRFSKGRPFVDVYNGSLLLMKWLVKNIGGSYAAADNRGRVMNYCWRVSSAKDVYFLLNHIWDMLIVKQDDATVVIKFLKDKYGERI